MKLVFSLILIFISLSVNASASPHIQRFTESNGLPQNVVTCVIQDKKGYIWLSSWNGLSRYDGYSFTHYKARQGDNCPLSTNRILFIRQTNDGKILCKCEDGYYSFSIKEKKFSALPNKHNDDGDRFRPTKKQISMIGEMSEYKGKEFRILYLDRQGGYWVYSHKGLDRVTPEAKKLAPVKYGNKGEEFIRTIFRDKSGRLFVADKNGYVRISAKNGDFIGYLDADGSITKSKIMFGANVYSMFQDSHGYTWIGSKPNGLFRLKNAKNGGFIVKSFTKNISDRYGINCNSIYSITEDRYERIILGTYGGGLNIIENPWSDSPKFINVANNLERYPKSALQVHSIRVVSGDKLLIGTNDGLYTCQLKKNPQDIYFYVNQRVPSSKTSLSNNQVMDILRSSDGTIYIATYGGGLNMITSKNILSGNIEFKSLTTDNGMASDVALSLCEGCDGNIWIVSEHCIMEYNPKKSYFSNYMGRFFSGEFSFSEVRPLYDSISGNMFFGTTQGLLNVNVKNKEKSQFKPQIAFDTPDYIDLPPEEKSINIRFAALDYNKNEQIHYAYKLEGVDDDWLYTNESHINLSNIPAGTYRLRVRSTNGDGVWCDNEASIMIHRTPFFNETPVAWMLYGGLLFALIIIVWKVAVYIRRLKKEIAGLRLSGDEQMEYIKLKLGDMIERKGESSPQSIKNADSIEDNKFKAKVEEFMRINVAEPDLNVSAFAKELGMSRSVLYIQMKKQFGCTPNNYIQNYRLDMAYRLLIEHRELNISEIAYKCGFSDPKYFSRCFKKAKGVTPSEIR